MFVSTTILAKKILQEQSQARSTALLCTQTTRSVLLVLLFFPDHQSYIYFKIDQNIMIIIKCIWYSVTRYIQRLSEWWTLANLILKGKTNTKHAVILYTYSTRCFTCCVCRSKLPDACRENDILINSSWYPSNVLMIICKFWYSRKWFMISSDKSDDPQKFLNVSPRGSADILES